MRQTAVKAADINQSAAGDRSNDFRGAGKERKCQFALEYSGLLLSSYRLTWMNSVNRRHHVLQTVAGFTGGAVMGKRPKLRMPGGGFLPRKARRIRLPDHPAPAKPLAQPGLAHACAKCQLGSHEDCVTPWCTCCQGKNHPYYALWAVNGRLEGKRQKKRN